MLKEQRLTFALAHAGAVHINMHHTLWFTTAHATFKTDEEGLALHRHRNVGRMPASVAEEQVFIPAQAKHSQGIIAVAIRVFLEENRVMGLNVPEFERERVAVHHIVAKRGRPSGDDTQVLVVDIVQKNMVTHGTPLPLLNMARVPLTHCRPSHPDASLDGKSRRFQRLFPDFWNLDARPRSCSGHQGYTVHHLALHTARCSRDGHAGAGWSW